MMHRSFVLIAFTLTCLLGVLYVRSRFLAIELSYEIGQARQHNILLERTKNQLMLELEVLKNPKRIASYAQQKLGLKNEANAITIMMRDGQRGSP